MVRLQPESVCDNVDDEFGISKENANPMHLLLALHFLKGYTSEKDLAGKFEMSEKAVRNYSGMYTRKVQLLLEGLVRH